MPEQRWPRVARWAQTKQLTVERIGQVARAAARFERVRAAIQDGPVLPDELLPRGFITVRARAGDPEVLQVQGGEISLDVARRVSRPGKTSGRTGAERLREPRRRNPPARRVGPAEQTLDQRTVNLQ